MSQPILDDDASTPIFVPAYPFVNAPGADFILRSSNGVDFAVHRAILSLVSPVLETTLSVPQPKGTPVIPVMDMEEDAVLLDQILRFFYPTSQPTVITLEELRRIIDILLQKYEMEGIIPTIKQQLEKYVVADPITVFSVACKHGWKDVAMAAAKASLKHPLRAVDAEAPPVLASITALAYHNLLHYHSRCAAAAQRRISGG
ncbi:hypothetical protein DFH07DRAFT_872906 [Mycena maculata]|uniref:BTB domain-containing protein n=1 Tax=Mycena maculata TaxID=230809 RepID=A0AAD7KHN2_9AGAR|nr:hypothetical protein DFH07DRAFT_872906 [Mycena maculata]